MRSKPVRFPGCSAKWLPPLMRGIWTVPVGIGIAYTLHRWP
jgi:hypothetical protein